MSPQTEFREAVAASEAQRQHETDAAHHAFRWAVECIYEARQPAAGVAEMEEIAREKADRIAELQRQWGDAIRAAERAHAARVDAAALAHGIGRG